MTGLRLPLTFATLTLLPLTAAAQDVPPSVRTAAACAPVGVAAPSKAPTVVALAPADDTYFHKRLFAPGDRVGVSQGTAAGLTSGNRYVIRRPMRFFGAPRAQLTIGWLRVVEASATAATATVEFACDGVAEGDLIEPTTDLTLPAGVTRTFTGGTLDAQRTLRVSYGTDGRAVQGNRDFVLADGGENRRVSVGDRYAAFARVTPSDEPETPVGEAVVVSVFEEQSLLRLTSVRDAVYAGDRLVARVGATDPGEAGSPNAADADRRTTIVIDRPIVPPADASGSTSAGNPATRSASAVTFEDVYFGLDRYSLRPEARTRLDDVVKTLQADPTLRIQVEGHTCSIGTAEYNLTLGDRRAKAVRAYLVEKGIAESRLTTVSYGEEKPAHDNGTADGRRLNRRAVLTVSIQR